MSTKMIIAAVVGTVVAFLLGWLIFGVLLSAYYDEQMVDYSGLMRGEGDMRLYAIALSQFCWCFLMALVFDRWANVRTFGSGLTTGFLISFLIIASADLMTWASMNLAKYPFFVVDVLLNAALGGIVGGVIGLMLGRGTKSAA